jgi:hypothetical protein
MQACLDELKRRSVPLLEVLPQLAAGDYLGGDEHLNADGAAVVAAAIVRSLGG